MDEPVFRKDLKWVTPKDLGLSEDEYNNALIEMFQEMKSPSPPVFEWYEKPPSTVTIKLVPTSYLDLEDQNN